MAGKKYLKIVLVLVVIAAILLIVLLVAELLKSGVKPGYCGNNICETGEDLENCPQDCKVVTCGNNKCESEETTFNCPEDCCSKLAPPYCPNGTLIPQGIGTDNCPLPPTCCGNNNCEGLETETNCPTDCKETPPSMNRGIYGYVSLLTGDCMPPIGPRCKQEYISTKVKVYSLISEDEMDGTYYVGKSEGWYDSVTNFKIKSAKCYGCDALCLYNGSKSEGWYDSCQDTSNISASLIRYDQCSKSAPKPYCKITKKMPIATITSKANGFYEISLANGIYSILAEDPKVESDTNEYCNSFSNNNACTVTINNNKVKFNILIDHATH
ncbi:MAG: hypothetical protein N3G19_02945 [Candidatus Pacearchaeota archaeon]|nr:hypothetical protein [Candidatus Pacearchaeota archaeon]